VHEAIEAAGAGLAQSLISRPIRPINHIENVCAKLKSDLRGGQLAAPLRSEAC